MQWIYDTEYRSSRHYRFLSYDEYKILSFAVVDGKTTNNMKNARTQKPKQKRNMRARDQ